MPSLVLLTPGTEVHLEGERLLIGIPAVDDPEARPETREVHLRDLEQIVVSRFCSMTMPALAECLSRDIPVVLTTMTDRVLGLCLPPAPHSAARVAQYRASLDPRFRVALATTWVEAKILNQKKVLQRLAKNRDDADVSAVARQLDELIVKARQSETVDTIRGYEGTAAGRYFEALAAFFPATAPFERRSRRPPLNAANALLSLAYTMLTSELECQIHSVGLDAAVGFYHEPADRRPALALDLVEPFRAPVGDAMTLDLLNHATVKPDEHFEPRDGGVYLNVDGRKRFHVAYERRMTREFQGPDGLRTTIRNELHRQVVNLKQAILDQKPFEPFLMA